MSADALLDKNFNVDDPKYFTKDYGGNSVVKAMVKMLREELQHELDNKKDELTRRLTSIESYL